MNGITKFEQVGCNIQRSALSVKWAITKFEQGCQICSEKGLQIKCSHCAIASCNTLVVAALAEQAAI